MSRLAQCPNCGYAVALPGNPDDARLVSFTVRLRAYDLQSAGREDDPVYDSAEGYPADHPGVDVIAGVRNVLTECVHELSVFHVQALRDLTSDYLDKKERGIRPTLSRTSGRGKITLEYNTAQSFTDGRQAPRYRARIDLNRVEKETKHV